MAGTGASLPADDPATVFVEVAQVTADRARLRVVGRRSYGYRILTAESTHPGRAIAVILLAIRDATGVASHIEFAWPQHGHARELLRFAFLGTGYEPAVIPIRRSSPGSAPTRQNWKEEFRGSAVNGGNNTETSSHTDGSWGIGVSETQTNTQRQRLTLSTLIPLSWSSRLAAFRLDPW